MLTEQFRQLGLPLGFRQTFIIKSLQLDDCFSQPEDRSGLGPLIAIFMQPNATSRRHYGINVRL